MQEPWLFLSRLQRPATAWEEETELIFRHSLKVDACSATLGSQVLLLGVSRWLSFNPRQGLRSPPAATPVPEIDKWESQGRAKNMTSTLSQLSARLSSPVQAE